MITRHALTAIVAFTWASAPPVMAQYIFLAPDLIAPQGSVVTATITMDSSAGLGVQGLSLGVCTDSAQLTVLGGSQGATTAALNGGAGPDFWFLDLYPNGFTCATVVSFVMPTAFPPAVASELVDMDYELVGPSGTISSLDVCSTLGSPSVTTTVVVGGVAFTPTQIDGSVEIAAPGPANYRASATDEARPGGTVTANILMDSVEIVSGFSFGLAHDPTMLSAIDVSPGAVTAAANGGAGPDVFLVDLSPAGGVGFTVDCVVSSTPTGSLQIGVDQDIVEVIYLVEATAGPPCSTTALAVTDTLGSPAVPVTATVAGVAEPALGLVGSVTLGAPMTSPPTGGYTLTATNSSALPGEVAAVSVVLDNEDEVQAFAFGLAHDPAFMTALTVTAGTTVSAANCGTGPDYFVWQGLSDGVTIGCVLGLSPPFGDRDIPTGSDNEIARVLYDVSTTTTLGGSPVEFVDTLGTPPVLVELTVDGQFVDPAMVDGAVATGVLFVRGDCNDDGVNDISDAVFLLTALFPGGGPPSIPTCDDACDANDDGGLDISNAVQTLNALFVPGGGPLPDPSVCGVDPTTDPLECAVFGNCP